MLHVLYAISSGGVNIGECKELVWLCRVSDDYGYGMVVDGNAQVTHSRTGRRVSHGYNHASFVGIRIGP